jgi:predicted MFS family arabinose efflux permease
MFGGFAITPYISPYYVANVGVAERSLALIYVAGGALTLFSAPAIGRLADRFGKLRVYRIVAPVAAALMLVVTTLPRVGLAVATAAFAALMVGNSGRMVVAMTMVTGSVEPHRRGGFLSANASVQHLAAGLGAYVGGQIIVEASDGTIRHFELVGLIAVASTLVSLWLAGRLRAAGPAPETSPDFSLGAAAEELGGLIEPPPAGDARSF